MTHELYTPADFTDEEIERRNVLAVLVIEGGIPVCKKCGASDHEIENFPTCEAYRNFSRLRRELHQMGKKKKSVL